MNDNINGGQLFTYNSPSSSSPATAAATSSYSSLNNHFNQKQMGYLTMEKDPWKHESSSMLLNAADHAENKINIRNPAEKKIKKPKHAFQTRSQVDILDDGYRWRKYGQKAVKNNKFPRNYYRCTHEGCNVKKQVQRLSNDEGIVVTTYEGVHSHPIEKSTDNFENILTQMQIYPG